MARDVRNPMEPPHDLRRLNGPELSALLHEVIMAAQANFDSLSGDAKEHARIFNSLARDVEMLGEYFGIEHDSEGAPTEITGGASGSHSELEDVTANQHHNQAHDQGDHNAAEAGDLSSIDIGDAAAAGSSVEVPNADHQHAYTAPTTGYPVDVAATEADGSATTPARADHRHAHGTGYVGAHTDLVEVAGDTMTGDLAMTNGADITFAAGSTLIFGGDTNLYRVSANGLKTDDELYAALGFIADSSSYFFGIGAATTSIKHYLRVLGDADYRLKIQADGKHLWGDGTNAGDTNLYRVSANLLKTDDSFYVNGDNLYLQSIASDAYLLIDAPATSAQSAYIRFQRGTTGQARNWWMGVGVNSDDTFTLYDATAGKFALRIDSSQKMWIGETQDTNLYRAGADFLATDDTMRIGGNLGVTGSIVIDNDYLFFNVISSTADIILYHKISGESGYRHEVAGDGKHLWGDGTNAPDTDLYRSAADTLKTDDSLVVVGSIKQSTTKDVLDTDHTAAADPHTGYLKESVLSEANVTDLTDGGATTLHSHAGGGSGSFISMAKWGFN